MIALITGSSGLVGSETARFFHDKGLEIHGVDNDLRKYFFGSEASTQWNTVRLQKDLSKFHHHTLDIRDQEGIDKLFRSLGGKISVIIHTAAQPSHDWAAKEPLTDFTVNANGTLILLEAARKHCPEAVFIFTSTNKVYGDSPNRFPFLETSLRYELPPDHPFFEHGINETLSIDQSQHSLFGASKVAADVLAQEYGRYFGLKTGIFRGGCLTGPAHSGAELHGFLAYLVKCVVEEKPYKIYGYKGKQVRDNIHSYDLANAFWRFFKNPKPASVYNIGGGRQNSCSVLEAIDLVEDYSGKKLDYALLEGNRQGDHQWWISDLRKFKNDYPEWQQQYSLTDTLTEMVDALKAPRHFSYETFNSHPSL